MSYAHFSPASEAAYIIQTEGKTMVNAFEFFFFLKSVTTGVSAKSTQKKKKKSFKINTFSVLLEVEKFCHFKSN